MHKKITDLNIQVSLKKVWGKPVIKALAIKSVTANGNRARNSEGRRNKFGS